MANNNQLLVLSLHGLTGIEQCDVDHLHSGISVAGLEPESIQALYAEIVRVAAERKIVLNDVPWFVIDDPKPSHQTFLRIDAASCGVDDDSDDLLSELDPMYIDTLEDDTLEALHDAITGEMAERGLLDDSDDDTGSNSVHTDEEDGAIVGPTYTAAELRVVATQTLVHLALDSETDSNTRLNAAHDLHDHARLLATKK